MENVVAFNNELSGLYETKPPISKAKMAAITKSAMRAIKFYKHVVQSVEKFILKCKPEYKVPGLYVIDSIVRQSRHQYGPEKDVFAPRFARNIKETFANLFRCAPEDKSRIIRVLNLWQKNNVFAPEVIQPIFDLADPNHPIYQLPPGGASGGPSGSGGLTDMSLNTANGLNVTGSSMDMSMGGMSSVGISSGPEDSHGGLPDLSSMSQEKAQNVLDNSTLRQLEHMQQYLKRQTAAVSSSVSKSGREAHGHAAASYSGLNDSGGGSGASGGGGGNASKGHNSESYSKYAKSSHELSYEDDDGHDDNSPQHPSKLLDNNNLKQLLNDPNVLRQLQTLQNFQKIKQQEEQYKNEMRLQEEAFEKQIQNMLKTSAGPSGAGPDANDFSKEVEFVSEEQKIEVINLDGNDSRSPTPDRDRYKRRRTRSRSRSRDRGRRRRSRSRSRSRSPRSSYRRRSSRERNERSIRDKEKDREHERERRKKGLPDIRKEHLSVCSTTLWVGHLSKLVYQEELSDTFGEYGDIVSIDQIVPRGCAFIVMNRRQDAHKAMQSLKNHKLQGRAITISWAAGKGVKSKEWKDFWDLELGVTYIPWNKLDESTDFDTLEEGGMFDEDSMPDWMKNKINRIKSLKETGSDGSIHGGSGNLMFGIDTTQPPPGPPPTSGPPPMMPMVPGQFSMAPPMSAPARMLGPMGMSLSGIPMPPTLVPGIPPPHTMMMPPSIMPPNFPPIPGQVGAGGGPPLGPHIGLPPGTSQFPPQPGAMPVTAVSSVSNIASNDDQMDIEMDEDDGPTGMGPPTTSSVSTPQLNFSQPPPMFGAGIHAAAGSGAGNESEVFNRDRNRGGPGGATRWGGRGNDDSEPTDGPMRWRENGGVGGPNFNDGGRGGVGGRGGGPMSIPPLDLNHPPQRPDFMGSDFDNRGGPRGGGPPARGGNHNGDFFGNMPNRFNQPTSLMQMRIPPPNAFNQRMGGPAGPGGPGGPGGPPVFMRGQGGPSGGSRQQGPGFFNQRNPFDRDMGGRGGGRGSGRGGGGRGGRGSGPGVPCNWSDDEGEDGNSFKRRGGAGVGNRFRDRDGPDDRHGRDRPGGGGSRRGIGDRPGMGGPRERHERDYRDGERDRDRGGRGSGGNRRNSRDECRDGGIAAPINSAPTPPFMSKLNADTEDDWDLELEEYDTKAPATKSAMNNVLPTAAVAAEAKENNSATKESMKNNAVTNSSLEAINTKGPKTNDNVVHKPQESQPRQSDAQEGAKQNDNKKIGESAALMPQAAAPAVKTAPQLPKPSAAITSPTPTPSDATAAIAPSPAPVLAKTKPVTEVPLAAPVSDAPPKAGGADAPPKAASADATPKAAGADATPKAAGADATPKAASVAAAAEVETPVKTVEPPTLPVTPASTPAPAVVCATTMPDATANTEEKTE